MNVPALIRRKRDGHALLGEEIRFLVHGYTTGHVPDYQKAALVMAICLRGMNDEEIAALTEAMLHSGKTLAWPGVNTKVVDKHSTGGLGDKASLILAPLLACEGLLVPMISGRGLGATGGTLDKLESIPSFRTDLSLDEIRSVTRKVGCVITGASAEIAPADRKLYALRDVTGTVESIPLITASIMSKKLAEGLDCLVLDVKFGSGAFMKTLDHARDLARSLVATGQRMGVRTAALITDMNQPLGRMVGNAVEVDESLAALRGEGPADLMEVTLALGAELLILANVVADREAGVARLEKHIASGAAMRKFTEMVAAQGGDLLAPRRIAPASNVAAAHEGHVQSIDAEKLGIAVIELGGGRKVLSDKIDHSVGLEMLSRIGDRVVAGQPLARVFGAGLRLTHALSMVAEAIVIGDEPAPRPKLIVERIES
jgi:pyrimidine-nucleoside phosphorylase